MGNGRGQAPAEDGVGRRGREFAALGAVIDVSARGLNLSDALSALTIPLADYLGITGGAILLYEEAGDHLRTQFSWGGLEAAAIRFSDALVESPQAALDLRALLTRADLRGLRSFFAALAAPGAQDKRRHLCVPLQIGGIVRGAAIFRSRQPNAFREESFPFFAVLGRHIAVVVHGVLLYAQARAGDDVLRSLSRRVAEVQEDERRRLARELHDEIGQSLTGLKLMLEMGARATPDQACASVLKAAVLVDNLLAQVRALSLDLRPAMLDDLGLLPALLWHFEHYTDQTGIDVNFKHMGLNRRFGPALETAAYRIVQEALTNVARHTDVKEAIVLAWADGTNLCLQIEDRGAGFELTSSRAAHASSGLAGMRERATALGGKFRLESSREDGTVIFAVLPCPAGGPEGAT